MAKAQLTFSDMEYSNRKKITKKEEFLNLMDDIVAWECRTLKKEKHPTAVI